MDRTCDMTEAAGEGHRGLVRKSSLGAWLADVPSGVITHGRLENHRTKWFIVQPFMFDDAGGYMIEIYDWDRFFHVRIGNQGLDRYHFWQVVNGWAALGFSTLAADFHAVTLKEINDAGFTCAINLNHFECICLRWFIYIYIYLKP